MGTNVSKKLTAWTFRENGGYNILAHITVPDYQRRSCQNPQDYTKDVQPPENSKKHTQAPLKTRGSFTCVRAAEAWGWPSPPSRDLKMLWAKKNLFQMHVPSWPAQGPFHPTTYQGSRFSSSWDVTCKQTRIDARNGTFTAVHYLSAKLSKPLREKPIFHQTKPSQFLNVHTNNIAQSNYDTAMPSLRAIIMQHIIAARTHTHIHIYTLQIIDFHYIYTS